MQVCNFFLKKVITTVFIISFFASSVFAQEMPKMPSMPDVSDISFPEIGDTFYHPSVPYRPKGKTTQSEDDNSFVKNDNTAVISENKSDDAFIKSILSGNDILSASDISSLYDSGLFSNLSSLSENKIDSFSSTNTTTILLQQVLKELEELKAEQKKATAAEKQQLQNYQQDNQTFRTRKPSILRFKINGYNIVDSLTSVFLSEPDDDGSFLLTADRKYYVNQKVKNETFYFLFKSIKGNGATTTFEVVPSIIQDSKYTDSYVYQFCQQKNLTAEKTGNLVVLHYNSDKITSEILLDIDN